VKGNTDSDEGAYGRETKDSVSKVYTCKDSIRFSKEMLEQPSFNIDKRLCGQKLPKAAK
jgi:hypothetical protein